MERKKLLLVDDDRDFRFFVKRALRGFEVEVDEAEDGEIALKLCEDEGGTSYDIILSDTHMPRLDGPRLREQLQERGYPAKFVLMSGAAQMYNQVDMAKPFRLDVLALSLRRHLNLTPAA